MELILKTDNLSKVAKVIAFARELDIAVEQHISNENENGEKENLKQRVLNFQAKSFSSFGDAATWEGKQREERKLPFPE